MIGFGSSYQQTPSWTTAANVQNPWSMLPASQGINPQLMAPWNTPGQPQVSPWQTQEIPQITAGQGLQQTLGPPQAQSYLPYGLSSALQGFNPMIPGGGFYDLTAKQPQQAPAPAAPSLYQIDNKGPVYPSWSSARDVLRETSRDAMNDNWALYSGLPRSRVTPVGAQR
jgi:hypothetical protein